MKKNSVLLIFSCLLFYFVSFGQEKDREVLRGKIIADTLDVENITVLNKNTVIGAVTDIDGMFSIRARENDTLVFQGLSFKSRNYVVREYDMVNKSVKIKLEVKINELNEVVITPNNLTGIVEVDAKRIETFEMRLGAINFDDRSYEDIRDTKPINPLASEGLSPLRGINFIRIANDLFVSKEKKEEKRKRHIQTIENEKWREYVLTKSFYEHLFSRYSYHFFVGNLGIAHEDVVPFIAYAEPPLEQMMELLKYENEINLIEYLITKSKEYKCNKLKPSTTNGNDKN